MVHPPPGSWRSSSRRPSSSTRRCCHRSPRPISPRPSPEAGAATVEPASLGRDFYHRPAPTVARELLGQVLEIRRGRRRLAGTIIEAEAYLGEEDPASHSFRGPTRRAAIMFGPPGIAYVYVIYGMYHCLNAVTGPEGVGSAVLIRALSPEVPPAWRPSGIVPERLGGPGRVCRELGVDLRMNGWDLSASPLRILRGDEVPDQAVTVGPRVGIRKAAELPLRFRRAGTTRR